MLLREIEPFVRKALAGSLTVKNTQDVFFELQAPDSRLFYISSGEGEMIVEGTPHPLSAGTVILLYGGVRYTWCPRRDSALEYIAVNFDYTMKNSAITTSFHPMHSDEFCEEDILEVVDFIDAAVLNAPIIMNETAIRESQLRQLVTEYTIGGKYSVPLLSSMLKTIIINIVRELESVASHLSEDSIILTQNVIKYIQKNYRDRISYDTLGEAFHLNPIYINRVFKRSTGSSLHAFILDYRINMAMELLRSSNIPTKDIATMVGFDDFPHFQKTFKRVTNKTPREYRLSREQEKVENCELKVGSCELEVGS